MLEWAMNLLSSVDWRAEDRQARLLPGYLPATEVLRIVEQQQLLPDVTGYDLDDDPRLTEEIAQSVLWVGRTPTSTTSSTSIRHHPTRSSHRPGVRCTGLKRGDALASPARGCMGAR